MCEVGAGSAAELVVSRNLRYRLSASVIHNFFLIALVSMMVVVFDNLLLGYCSGLLEC